MSNSSNSSGGIGFLGILTIVFITLKLTKYIDWSWYWVLSPLWIPFVLVVLIVIIFSIIRLIFNWKDVWNVFYHCFLVYKFYWWIAHNHVFHWICNEFLVLSLWKDDVFSNVYALVGTWNRFLYWSDWCNFWFFVS